MYKKRAMFLYVAILLIIVIPSVEALSNQSIQANSLIQEARAHIEELQSKGIPILRANESYTQAVQLYGAQVALEEANRIADYSLVILYAQEVSSVKESALKANDELRLFNGAYSEAEKEYNLSSMDSEYNSIQKSFTDERFEDTLTLINKGYTKLEEIQSSQTATRVFLENTSKTFKNFWIKNWKWIALTVIIIVILTTIFWKIIIKLKIRAQIYNLALQKETLYNQIKKLQSAYFKTKTISETEFYSKVDRFKEMIRDIDRKIPLLKEELIKSGKRVDTKSKSKKSRK